MLTPGNASAATTRSGLLLGLVTAVTLVLALPAAARAAPPGCQEPSQLGVVFVVDDSGSMADNDPDKLRATAVEIGLRAMPKGSIAALSAFTYSADRVAGPTALTSQNAGELGTRFRDELAADGGTHYEEAFAEAQAQLDAMPSTVDRKAVIFVSDGQPNDPRYTADRKIAEAGVPIFTIGFGDAVPQELSAISGRSPGGTAASVRSVGETQSIVGRIVAGLTCQLVLGGDLVIVPPGGEATYPFDVKADQRDMQVLATWANAHVDVVLRRPSGTPLKAGSERRGETFEQGDTFALATSEIPDAGHWEVVLRSTTQVPVTVAVDFLGRTFDRPGYGPPPLDADCQDGKNADTVAGRKVWGSCIRRAGDGIVSRGVTRVNGLDFRPPSGGSIEIAGDGRVHGKGQVGVTVSPKIPGLNGFLRYDLKPSSVNVARSLRLGFKLKDLIPGKRFRRTVAGEVLWDADGLTFKFSVGAGLNPIEDANKPADPDTGVRDRPGLALGASLRSTNETGLIADRIEAKGTNLVAFRKLFLKEVALTYRPVARVLSGSATLSFGDPELKGALVENPNAKVELSFDLDRFRLVGFKLEGDAINQPIPGYPFVFIKSLGLDVRDETYSVPATPYVRAIGTGALTLGPALKVPVLGDFSLAQADGKLDIDWLDRITATSGVKLLSLVNVAEGGLTVDLPQRRGTVYGRIDYTVPKLGVGYVGNGTGALSFDGGFRLEMITSGRLRTPLGNRDAQTIITNRGLGFCSETKVLGHEVPLVSIGGAFPVDDLLGGAGRLAGSFLHGCDFAKITAKLRAHASAAGGQTPAGPRQRAGEPVLFYVPAIDGAPQDVVVTPPGLPAVSVPAGATGPVSTTGVLAGRDGFGGLYALVAGRTAGSTALASPAGPLTGVRMARALSTPKGTGVVRRGPGGRQTLTYRLRGLERADRVRLVSLGAGASQTLTRRAPRRGQRTFVPAVGHGSRTVYAVVTQGDDLRATIRLARFAARVTRPKPSRRAAHHRGR